MVHLRAEVNRRAFAFWRHGVHGFDNVGHVHGRLGRVYHRLVGLVPQTAGTASAQIANPTCERRRWRHVDAKSDRLAVFQPRNERCEMGIFAHEVVVLMEQIGKGGMGIARLGLREQLRQRHGLRRELPRIISPATLVFGGMMLVLLRVHASCQRAAGRGDDDGALSESHVMSMEPRTVRPKSAWHPGLVDDMAAEHESPAVAPRASKRGLDDAAPVQDDAAKRQRGAAGASEASPKDQASGDASAKEAPHNQASADASANESPHNQTSTDASAQESPHNQASTKTSEAPKDQSSRETCATSHASPPAVAPKEKEDDKSSAAEHTAPSEKTKSKGPALGFGAFASRSAPFQSATALTAKADAASDQKEKDWATDKAAAPIKNDGDNVVRMKEVPKPDVELTTGEEEEETVASARAKLYSLAENQVWKERGTGAIKINVHRPSASARLVMRLDAVLKLILNVKLFPGMQCHLDQERFLRVVAMESDGLTHFLLKFGNAADAHAFLTHLQEHIPASS